jgi:hypothetical protein
MMEFKQWLESAIQMDPYEAMEVMGLKNLAGKTLDQAFLMQTYRDLARERHPDLHPDDPEATSKFQELQNAFEALRDLVGQTLPGSRGPSPRAGSRPGSHWGGGGGVEGTPHQTGLHQPENYTEQDIDDFAKQMSDLGYFKSIKKQSATWVPMTIMRFSDASIGSAEKTQTLTAKSGLNNAEGVLKKIKETMEADGATYPDNIVTVVVRPNWEQGFITYYYPRRSDTERMFGIHNPWGYRSIVFQAPPKKKKKAAGVGMKRADVEAYLTQNGLKRLRYGGRAVFYGLPQHEPSGRVKTIYGEVIKLQPKVFKLVSRSQYDRGYKKETMEVNVRSVNYGDLTQDFLDKAIKWVKVKAGAEEPENPLWKMSRGDFQKLMQGKGKTDVSENNRLYWQIIGKAIDAGKPVPQDIADQYKSIKGFKEWYEARLNEMFSQPPDMPVKAAMAVYQILQGDPNNKEARIDAWEEVDKHPRDTMMDWFRRILEMNPVPADIKQELIDWFAEQLKMHDN